MISSHLGFYSSLQSIIWVKVYKLGCFLSTPRISSHLGFYSSLQCILRVKSYKLKDLSRQLLGSLLTMASIAHCSLPSGSKAGEPARKRPDWSPRSVFVPHLCNAPGTLIPVYCVRVLTMLWYGGRNPNCSSHVTHQLSLAIVCLTRTALHFPFLLHLRRCLYLICVESHQSSML